MQNQDDIRSPEPILIPWILGFSLNLLSNGFKCKSKSEDNGYPCLVLLLMQKEWEGIVDLYFVFQWFIEGRFISLYTWGHSSVSQMLSRHQWKADSKYLLLTFIRPFVKCIFFIYLFAGCRWSWISDHPTRLANFDRLFRNGRQGGLKIAHLA